MAVEEGSCSSNASSNCTLTCSIISRNTVCLSDIMLLCHHSGTMRTLPAIVRAIMFAFVIHRACADMSVGAVGSLSIESALKHAAVRAADGLNDTTAGPARAGVNIVQCCSWRVGLYLATTSQHG